MSLQARKLGLVALLAFILLGCESEELGIGLPPKDGSFTLGYYEHVLEPQNSMEDSISNMGSGRLLVGQFQDDLLGEITTASYFSLSPAEVSAPMASENAVADSLVLRLRVNYTYANKPDFLVNFRVYESRFILESGNVYETFQQQPVGDVLESVSYSVPTNDFIDDGTVLLEIHMPLPYADVLLDSLGKTNDIFQVEDDFKKFIPGISLVPFGTSEGIVGFDVDDADSQLVLYYTDETFSAEWAMNVSSSEHYSYVSRNELHQDWTGTALEGLTEFHTDFESSDEYIYYQSGTGLNITAETLGLDGLRDTLQNTIISTAVLEIDGVESSPLLPVPSFMRVYLTDETNDVVRYNDQVLRVLYQRSRSDEEAVSVPTFTSNASEEVLVYNQDLNKYQADVTMYVQSYLEGRMDLKKIWIADLRLGANVSRFRTLKENVRIKIYYTKAGN